MKSVSAKKLLALLAAQMFFYGLYMGGLQSVIADIAAGFGKGQSGIGMLVSAQHITSVAMPTVMGVLADRIGKKKVLIAFSMVYGIGCAAAGFAQGIVMYIIGVLLIGGGCSVCESLGCAIMNDMDSAQAGRYINLTQGILCIGAILGPVFMRLAVSQFGADWRLLFIVCTVAFLLTGGMLITVTFPQASTEIEKTEDQRTMRLFGSTTFICLFAAIVLYVGIEGGYGYFVDSLFTERLKAPDAGATAISLYWAGMAACRFICSMKAFDNRRALIICFVLSAATLFGFILTKNTVLCLALSACVGAAYGPTWSLLVAEAAARFPQHSAAATGMMSTGGGIAGIVYPMLMGFTSQYVGMTAAFILLAATAALGVFFCFKIPAKTNMEKSV